MISFHFNIRNPYSNNFRNIKCLSGSTPFKYKFWELEIYKSSDILDFFVRLTHRESHAGIHCGIGFLSYTISFNFYDSRHWNIIENRWEIVDD